MALLTILKYPDPRLKLVAEPVEVFDNSLATLCADLLETMYAFDGIGLAATQVNVPLRVFVLDISEEQNQSMCFINPVITHRDGKATGDEGCLSFPGIFGKVTRDANITVEFFDVSGNAQTLQATHELAVCIQHEIDHLNGITFYDHLSSLKKKLLSSKLKKQRDQIL